MGVPRLFSFMRRTFPSSINVDKAKVQISELYLDANALLYPIAEVSKDPTMIGKLLLMVAQSYGETYNCICHIYIDGPAHMGKVRQQRMRRFGYEPVSLIMSTNVDVGDRQGTIPVSTSMDEWSPAMFTPGTEMMELIHQYLLEYLGNYSRVGTYSSYHEPGEGEHKIMRDIRKMRAGSHMGIVGKDADLLLLSMGLVEDTQVHPYILRHNDILAWGGNPNGYTPEDPIYHIDCTSLRREILNQFSIVSIWDFIISTFIVGNDFLPPIPECINIYDVMPLIQELKPSLYREGTIDWTSLSKFIKDLTLKVEATSSLRKVYTTWIPDIKYTNVNSFSLAYNFVISPFPVQIGDLLLSWMTTVYWIFKYYHDGLDSASISWQYPTYYVPSLAAFHEMRTSSQIIGTISSIVDQKMAPLTPVQALAAVLPIWLHDLIPSSHIRDKLRSLEEYYPYAYSRSILDEPKIPNIPYEVVSTL